MAARVLVLGRSEREILVDKPISRLSKRMTKNPASIRRFTKFSGQNISCEPNPIISSKGGFLGSPPTSTQSSISLETGIMACCIIAETGEGYQSYWLRMEFGMVYKILLMALGRIY